MAYDDKSVQGTKKFVADKAKATPKFPERERYLDQDGDASNSSKAGKSAPLPRR